MPSPFPGMNPYLEQDDTWEDFHHQFITYAANVLTPQVGEHYIVKIEVRFILHELSADERKYFGRADVGLASRHPTPADPGSAGVVAAPVHLSWPAVEMERHSWVEIRDRRNRRVVTVLELLSPTNKRTGPDRDDYVSKRTRVLTGGTNLVEIDLRRGGTRPWPPELPPCDYYVLVSRWQDWPQFGFWPLSLRGRLPTVPIPLTPPDADVPIDLQTLLDRVYDAADSGKYIYVELPSPPLSADDLSWAQQFVPRAAGEGAGS